MFIKLFSIALPVFLAIDMIWLVFIAKNFYQQHIGFLMRSDVDFIAAGVFYLLFVSGLVMFVISPAVTQKSPVYAIGYGALFGLITYATYDLTNQATVKDWPLIVTIVDLTWGVTVAMAVSILSYYIAQRI